MLMLSRTSVSTLCLTLIWVICAQQSSHELAYEKYNQAIRCHQADDVPCALNSYQEAIRLKEDFPEAHQNLGILFEAGTCDFATGSRNGSLELALTHHRKSIEYARTPSFAAGAWCNLIGLEMRIPFPKDDTGNSRYLTWTRQLIELSAQLSEPHTNLLFTLGRIYVELGDYQQALTFFLQILHVDPSHAMALLNVGNHYFRSNDFSQAAHFYHKSVVVLEDACYRSANSTTISASGDAVTLENKVGVEGINLIMALNNMGQALRQAGRLDEAILAIEKALLHMPRDRPVSDEGLELWSLNNIYAMRGLGNNWGSRFEYLELHLTEAAQALSNDSLRFATPSLVGGGAIIDPYTFSLQRYVSRSLDLQVARVSCMPFLPQQLTHTKVRGPLLNVGFLSYDWRDHPMGRLTARLVTNHNKTRISSTCISYGPNDQSSVREYVRRHSQIFVDLESVSNDQDAYAIVRDLNLDVLVDLTSHTYMGRIAIAALKPAPLVINYLGFPGTTGCEGFDYSMVDKAVVPPDTALELFSEQLIYLPHSYQTNSMPINVPLCNMNIAGENGHPKNSCRVRMVQDRRYRSQSPYSLWGSANKLWLCSFNHHKKFEPTSFAAWMNVMRENPAAVLFLLDFDESNRQHVLMQAAFHGVTPSRFVFIPNLPWTDHLYRSASCDLVLDTFVYGAHTTSSDTLWMSVPLLVLKSWGSGRMPSRVAAAIEASIYSSQLGDDTEEGKIRPQSAPITIASSVKDYEILGRRILHQSSGRFNRASGAGHGLLRVLKSQLGSLTLRAATFSASYSQDSVEHALQGAAGLQVLHQSGSLRKQTAKLPHLVLLKPEDREISRGKLELLKKESLKRIGTCMSRRKMAAAARIKTAMGSEAKEMTMSMFTGDDDDMIEGCRDPDLAAMSGRVLLSFPDVATGPILRSFASRQPKELPCSTIAADFATAVVTASQTEEGDSSSSPSSIALEKCLLMHPEVTVKALLTAQYQRIQQCELEARIFRRIAPLLFEATTGWGVYLEAQWSDRGPSAWDKDVLVKSFPLLRSRLPHIFNDSTRGWASLSPVMILALRHVESAATLLAPSDASELRRELALTLNNHAVCSIALGDSSEAAVSIASALVLHPAGQRLMDLGLVLEPLDSILSYQIASHAALVMHEERFHQRISLEVERRRLGAKTLSIRRPPPRHLVSVAIYCYEYGNDWWGAWGPSSLESGGGGMGGSEEAVIYLAEELVRLGGFHVTVYANPPDSDRAKSNVNGVSYYHHNEFDASAPAPDVFISWRYSFSLALGRRSRASFLWLHDLVPAKMLPSYLGGEKLDGILVQSNFHLEDILSKLALRGYSDREGRALLRILPNGISNRRDPKFKLSNGVNSRTTFVYGSSPSRGLQQLLEAAWPIIFKEAWTRWGVRVVLKVYYGFPATVVAKFRRDMGHNFDSWFAHMHYLLSQPGVELVGSIDHQRLAEEYAKAGFMLFPTAFSETGCITLIKAMCSGALPITSKYSHSVLPNLTMPYDLGPPRGLVPGDDYEWWMINHYVPAVLGALNASLTEKGEDAMKKTRSEMKKNVRKRMVWSESARILVGHLEKVGVRKKRFHISFF